MQAARLDLEFDKDSWLRIEIQIIRPAGDLISPEDKQYRFVAKESLATETMIYNDIMQVVVHEEDDNYWMIKQEIYRPRTDIDPDLLHYIIRQENPVEGNEDSDEALIFGTIDMKKRI